jgi:hypothetical protein
MKYRRFGRTELQMPVFSCGGMRYQQSWDDISPETVDENGQRNLEETILRALELGINHIETARGYGSSEMQLGWILPRIPREKMIVQTKVAPFATAGEFRETFEKSMRYLKLDHVELLSIHGINNAELLEWTIRPGGCLDEARKIQREGRCKFIGFSTHATTDIITKTIETDAFDYVNLHWYFVNELNWSSVQAATKRDMGVFIISPNDKGGKLYAPPDRLRELCAPLTPMQWNDLWCLSRPEVHTLSLGASCPRDFEEHVAALDYYEHAAEITAPIEQKLRAEMARVLGEDWCNRWQDGLPNFEKIPGNINVQEIARLFTYARGLGLIDWGKMRYNLLGGAGGHWFPGETAASFEDDAIVTACSNSPFAKRIPEMLREAHALLLAQPKKRLSQSGD